MSNLVLSINKADGSKEDVTLTGNIIYHESFNTKNELDNTVGLNGESENPSYLLLRHS